MAGATPRLPKDWEDSSSQTKKGDKKNSIKGPAKEL